MRFLKEGELGFYFNFKLINLIILQNLYQGNYNPLYFLISEVSSIYPLPL